MTRHECAHEAAVLDVLLAGGPDRLDAALRQHVQVCPSCAGLVDVALALLNDRETALSTAHVPTAATVWWRARLRARREAAVNATRPITLWQGLAAACGIGGLAAAVGFSVPSVRRFFGWMLGSFGPTVGEAAGWPHIHWSHPATITTALVAMLFAIIMPVALYLAVRER